MVLIRLAKFVTAGLLAVVPLAVLPPDAVADPNVSVLAFGLVGSQSVFESEAKGSAAILARQLGAGNVVSSRMLSAVTKAGTPVTRSRQTALTASAGASVLTAYSSGISGSVASRYLISTAILSAGWSPSFFSVCVPAPEMRTSSAFAPG